jgi:ATP-dependent DNA helicase RecG
MSRKIHKNQKARVIKFLDNCNKEKMLAKHSLAYGIAADKGTLKTFVSSFPFTPTNAQYDAIQAILDDIKKKEPMGRLLEGDVGSGKTIVGYFS